MFCEKNLTISSVICHIDVMCVVLQAGRAEGNAVDYERAKREAMVCYWIYCVCRLLSALYKCISFIHSFIHSFILSFFLSFIHSLFCTVTTKLFF